MAVGDVLNDIYTKKGEIATAITNKGVATTQGDPLSTFVTNINNITGEDPLKYCNEITVDGNRENSDIGNIYYGVLSREQNHILTPIWSDSSAYFRKVWHISAGNSASIITPPSADFIQFDFNPFLNRWVALCPASSAQQSNVRISPTSQVSTIQNFQNWYYVSVNTANLFQYICGYTLDGKTISWSEYLNGYLCINLFPANTTDYPEVFTYQKADSYSKLPDITREEILTQKITYDKYGNVWVPLGNKFFFGGNKTGYHFFDIYDLCPYKVKQYLDTNKKKVLRFYNVEGNICFTVGPHLVYSNNLNMSEFSRIAPSFTGRCPEFYDSRDYTSDINNPAYGTDPQFIDFFYGADSYYLHLKTNNSATNSFLFGMDTYNNSFNIGITEVVYMLQPIDGGVFKTPLGAMVLGSDEKNSPIRNNSSRVCKYLNYSTGWQQNTDKFTGYSSFSSTCLYTAIGVSEIFSYFFAYLTPGKLNLLKGQYDRVDRNTTEVQIDLDTYTDFSQFANFRLRVSTAQFFDISDYYPRFEEPHLKLLLTKVNGTKNTYKIIDVHKADLLFR
jgi:hypothetical protein